MGQKVRVSLIDFCGVKVASLNESDPLREEDADALLVSVASEVVESERLRV